jgi:hypothetical protein
MAIRISMCRSRNRARWPTAAPAGHLAAYVEFKGLDHQLESQQARTRILSDSDALLRKAMSIAP